MALSNILEEIPGPEGRFCNTGGVPSKWKGCLILTRDPTAIPLYQVSVTAPSGRAEKKISLLLDSKAVLASEQRDSVGTDKP